MTSPRDHQSGPPAMPEARLALEPRDFSIATEVISDLEIANTLAHLESRLDSIEIDLARLAGSRDDDARRIAGETAIMRARVEDALDAIAATTQELRTVWVGMERRLAALETRPDAVPAVPAIQPPAAPALEAAVADAERRLVAASEAFERRAAEMLGAVGVRSEEVAARVEAIAGSVGELRQGVLQVASAAGGAAFSARRLADLELRVASVAGRLDRLVAPPPRPTSS